jgi:Xaa-Pro aminopeptidase
MRSFLTTGDPLLAWPKTPTDEDRAALDEILQRHLTAAAVSLVDALRVTKDLAAIDAASGAMKAAVDRHREALEAIEDRKGRTDGE